MSFLKSNIFEGFLFLPNTLAVLVIG